MRVLIVAKTRRGSGACVGGLAQDGRSVRLIAADADRNEHAGLEYNVGEVWEIDHAPDPHLIPPHVENIIVVAARRLKVVSDIEAIVHKLMPPVCGGPELLFDGRLQALPSGTLYIAERSGLPPRSTMFWTPDRPLERDTEGKRIRYRYPTDDGGRTLTFVGFQEPIELIPAGTLLRVSLAHWWKPSDAPPEEELRCHAQLSGWFLSEASSSFSFSFSSSKNFSSHPRTKDDNEDEGAGMARDDSLCSADLSKARQVLKDTFGYHDFLLLQAEVVSRILKRRDTLVIMPTGGGKSLCYQLPALLFDGLTVVVSPLIALMQDQVSQLHELAVHAAFLNSTLALREYTNITSRVRSGEVKVLYVAPETLLRPETLVLLEQSRLACLAVDEAHCISEWGHDFRPEYRQIQQVRRRFPQAVCVALTATATKRVRQDICRLLGIESDGEFVASFNRSNLFLAAQPRRDGLGQTLAFLEQHRGQSGIIYCATKKQVDQLAAELAARGWPALSYHAGLDAATRRRNQDAFIRDDAGIMVATVAFGMGINKSNVRFVLHYNLPKDLENYYQEIGRAGRDGLPANCLLLHSRADAITIRGFIDEGAESERAGRQARLDAMMRYAETAGCRRGPLLGYFGEKLTSDGEPRCGHCDNCHAGERQETREDVTEAARQFLTCVQRTGECFGTMHIIDVLRGSKSQRVLNRRHDRLPVYGAGKEFSAEHWREWSRQFLEQGLVEQDLQHGGLSLTERGRAVLNGETVSVRRHAATAVAAIREETAAAHDPELFEQLRRKRRALADAAGVPPYVVFSDRTLVEMAAQLPRSQEQLLGITGVGQAKLTSYGETFLRVIRDFCATRNIPETASAAPANEPTAWLTAKRRFEEVGEAYESGATLDELAKRWSVKRATVLQNLDKYCEAGHRLDAARLLAESRLSERDRARAFLAFEQHGTERLGPIHEALGGEVSYEELHLLRLHLRNDT